MNDTNPAIEAQFRKLIMMKSRQDRLLMGCSMFGAAKQIVRSSIVQKQPKISAREMKAEFFLRFYGMEFSEAVKGEILAALADACLPAGRRGNSCFNEMTGLPRVTKGRDE